MFRQDKKEPGHNTKLRSGCLPTKPKRTNLSTHLMMRVGLVISPTLSRRFFDRKVSN